MRVNFVLASISCYFSGSILEWKCKLPADCSIRYGLSRGQTNRLYSIKCFGRNGFFFFPFIFCLVVDHWFLFVGLLQEFLPFGKKEKSKQGNGKWSARLQLVLYFGCYTSLFVGRSEFSPECFFEIDSYLSVASLIQYLSPDLSNATCIVTCRLHL